MISGPCKDCKQRQINCHSICQAYKEYRKEIDAANAERRKQLIADAEHSERIQK